MVDGRTGRQEPGGARGHTDDRAEPCATEGPSTDEDVSAQVGAFAERLLMTGLAGLEAMTIALGRDLGLYAALDSRGASNAADLAETAAIAQRYAQE